MWINTDLPPGEDLGFLGPPSWTSNSFNLLNYLPPEMVSLVFLLQELPSLRVSLWSGLECEVFFLSVYVELDLSLPDINVGIDSAQKWSSKDDGHF